VAMLGFVTRSSIIAWSGRSTKTYSLDRIFSHKQQREF
jgi:hypothetical protein